MAAAQKNKTKSNPWALLPMGVFIVLYFIMLAIINNAPTVAEKISDVPIIPIFFIALIVSMVQYRGAKFTEKAKIMGRAIGDESVVSMLLILVMAGVFTGSVGKTAANSVAYFMLDICPPTLAVCAIFLISCLVSLAMGTSIGAITILVPIGCTIAAGSGHSPAICVASVVGGSMFGDNLSVISDTTIACTTGQGCKMSDKFKANLLIVLPAAIVALLIIGLLTFQTPTNNLVKDSYNLIEVIPYCLVLILGIIGINVFVVLGVGIVAGIIIGFIINQIDVITLISNITSGVLGMAEVIILIIIVSAMSALIKENGGFDFILEKVQKAKNQYSAQYAICILVILIDILVANNTVAILVANPIAKEIGKLYKIKRRRIASLLDTCSCASQGILPYGTQMVIAAEIAYTCGAELTTFQLIPFCVYQFVLLITVFLTILIGHFTKGHVKTDNNYKDESTN